MAAEFDSSGFSAVEKFFGTGTEEATREKKSTGSSSAYSKSSRRGGVGANQRNDRSTNSVSSDLLAKQVLSIGRKRGRGDSNEDADENYGGDGVDDHGVHDVDEGDGGRTSIKEKKTIASKKSGDKDKNTKPKKKLGKKERQRQKDAATTEEFKSDANNNKDHHQSSDVAITGTISKPEESDGVKLLVSKRKRRKVRSRQKNIRKDNRSADEKPAHLIPGNRNYQGRPMTQATREKLNLPTPPPKKHRKFNNETGDNSSLFVIDRDPDSSGNDVGVKLAIDELMSFGDENDVEKSVSLNESKDKEPRKKGEGKKVKKKKKRFKNLV